MKDTYTANQLAQIAARVHADGRLLRWWPLAGGISAQTTALEIAGADGTTHKLVLRQHSEIERQHNPNIAADEFRLLKTLHAAGLPVPEPEVVDTSGAILPAPYLVLAYVEGETDSAPSDLHQLAGTLAAIHQVDGAVFDFLPRQADIYAAKFSQRPAMLDDSLDEGRIRDALETMWPLPRTNSPALLHGDFWPGNVLWHAGEIVAVIDWEDAHTGDPLEDLGNARLEILWASGAEAMHDFTQHYQSSMTTLDYSHLPCWDLCAALRPASKIGGWGLDAATEHTFREGHRWFVEQAFEKLRL